MDYLEKLSGFPLSESPTLDDLEMTRAALQNCYRDRKELNFKGTIVDYLCFISSEYIMLDWARMFDSGYPGKPGDWLLDVCKRYQENAKNMVRLFCKDASYVLDSQPAKKTDPKAIYDTVNELRWEFIKS